jgi:hypothetical protein
MRLMSLTGEHMRHEFLDDGKALATFTFVRGGTASWTPNALVTLVRAARTTVRQVSFIYPCTFVWRWICTCCSVHVVSIAASEVGRRMNARWWNKVELQTFAAAAWFFWRWICTCCCVHVVSIAAWEVGRRTNTRWWNKVELQTFAAATCYFWRWICTRCSVHVVSIAAWEMGRRTNTRWWNKVKLQTFSTTSPCNPREKQ